MTLPELSIRRPVLTIAVSLLATIAGVIGLLRHSPLTFTYIASPVEIDSPSTAPFFDVTA